MYINTESGNSSKFKGSVFPLSGTILSRLLCQPFGVNMEVWKTIEKYPDYEVSNMGKVRSWLKWNGNPVPRILKGGVNAFGYVVHKLVTTPQKCKCESAHVLVLEAFKGKRPLKMDACHNNGIKTDNRLDNLRWGTRSENQMDRFKHGTQLVGENHYSSKLKDKQVLEIREKYKNGAPIFLLSEEYGVARPTISHIVNGKTWKHLNSEASK